MTARAPRGYGRGIRPTYRRALASVAPLGFETPTRGPGTTANKGRRHGRVRYGGAWLSRRVWILEASLRSLALLLSLGTALAHASTSEEFQRLLSRGLILSATGSYSEAANVLRKALALKPRRSDLRLRVAVLEMRLGKPEAARKTLRSLIDTEPNNGDALRELGALLLAQRQARQAEPFLRRAAIVRPRDGVALYYLGLSLHAQEQGPASRRLLRRAARLSPKIASQCHYYRGASLAREEKYREARLALARAIGANTDATTIALAKRLYQAVEARARPQKRWGVSVSLGVVFDSNVSLLPDLATDLPLPPGSSLISQDASVTTAAAARMSTEVNFEGRPLVGRHVVGLGAGFFQSKHVPERVEDAFEPASFDLTAFGAYGYYAYRPRPAGIPMRFEIAVGHFENILDTFRSARRFLQIPWIRPSYSLSYGGFAATRISYRFGVENFLTGNQEGTIDDRDGIEHIILVEQVFAPGSGVTARIGFLAGVFGADGDQWDATIYGGSLDLRLQPFSWFGLGLGTEYLHRGFPNSAYTVTGPGLQPQEVQRVDDRIAAFGRVDFGIAPFRITALYTVVHNVSSASQIFSYTRQIAGVEFGFRY